jgi:hypothetical protein
MPHSRPAAADQIDHDKRQNLLSVDRCCDFTVQLLAVKMIKGAIIVNNHG